MSSVFHLTLLLLPELLDLMLRFLLLLLDKGRWQGDAPATPLLALSMVLSSSKSSSSGSSLLLGLREGHCEARG